MITLQNLTKTYSRGVTALDQLSLEIGPGMFGLLGPNGSGKTTLMRMMAGLLRPTAGHITIFGHDIATAPGRQQVKRQLGYLPQELGLYPHLTAREFLDYVAILKGVTASDERRRQIGELLDIVRLTDVANRPLKTFSGGMKRRIGIAQALLGAPRLLIVDEPTTGLDPEERVRIRAFFSEMARQTTVILSTHVIEDIGASCADLAILRKGRLRYRGSPTEVVRQAQGKVWMVTTGSPPPTHLTVVSALQTTGGVRYRLIGEDVPMLFPNAEPTEPSLEDSYIWLMRD